MSRISSHVLTAVTDWVVRLTTTTPYEWVRIDASAYLERHGRLHLLRKLLGRWLPLAVSGQLFLQRRTIGQNSRVLWVHRGKPNFGDTLLELAGRTFLRGWRGRLDLLTLPHLAPLFRRDDVFSQVLTDARQIKASYDVILFTEINHQSIRDKLTHWPTRPWTSLFGYFWGPDRNQALFSSAAVNDRFALDVSPERLLRETRPSIVIEPLESKGEGSAPILAIAVGGIDPKRSYLHWSQVLLGLDRWLSADVSLAEPLVVRLLGSENGIETAHELQQQTFKTLSIQSSVAQLDLCGTARLIAGVDLFVGCDGGLLHVAHGLDRPTVALFADEDPQLRLTEACDAHAIRAGGPVSQIPPTDVMEAIAHRLQAFRSPAPQRDVV